MIGALLAAGLMIQPVGGLFPDASDVRIQKIAKADGETGWPFVAKSGKLICVRMFPKSAVAFIPDEGPATKDGIVLDVANPYGLMLSNWILKKPLLPYDTPEELIKRIAPFVAQGLMLCKQDNGPVVPGAEL